MDKKTQQFLNSISASAPKDLLRRAMRTKKDPDAEEEKAMAEYLYKKTLLSTGNKWDTMTNEKIQKYTKKMLANNAFDKPDTYDPDPEAQKELQLYYKTKIEQAIRKGIIKPAEEDDFIRKMRK
jgi:hypothetical protein